PGFLRVKTTGVPHLRGIACSLHRVRDTKRRGIMTEFVIPLDAPQATDADLVGPKAANLAALARAGLPTPGGFALTAAAYRRQIEHLGIADQVRAYDDADERGRRKLSVAVRLALYQEPIAPDVLEPLLAAWRA